jgi:hypothetical protein
MFIKLGKGKKGDVFVICSWGCFGAILYRVWKIGRNFL